MVSAEFYDAAVLRWEAIGDGRRPPVWRSIPLIVVVMLCTLVSVTFSPQSWLMQSRGHGIDAAWVLVAFAAMVLLPLGLLWRHSHPIVLTLVSAASSLLFATGNTLPLVALACLLGRRKGPAVWLTSGVVAVTSAVVIVLDFLARPQGASVHKAVLGPAGDPSLDVSLSPVVPVVVFLVGLGLAVGSGLLVRSRREASSAQQVATSERVTSGRLGDEVARRQERELIAREVHDAMGHRLSLLNLHAGALEANAAGDKRLEESASLVRRSAGEAMEDLRSLLDMLREPLGSDQAAIPLTSLQDVVRESFGGGQPINSSIFVVDADRASGVLSRAVYRIVQEALTNARKHAPGEAVWLSVTGSPAQGITIDVRNRAVGSQPVRPGSHRGLTGIAERAELLGGTVTYGLDDDGSTFRVHVDLPWQDAERSG